MTNFDIRQIAKAINYESLVEDIFSDDSLIAWAIENNYIKSE